MVCGGRLGGKGCVQLYGESGWGDGRRYVCLQESARREGGGLVGQEEEEEGVT